MPKRKRLFTPLKNRSKSTNSTSKFKNVEASEEVNSARGRLKGALMEVLSPVSDDSDASLDYVADKGMNQEQASEDEDIPQKIQRQSYVLKLFDRSVDLSQFKENSPLYPICRAWIANQPKANYKELGKRESPPPAVDSIELPGPAGPPVSKIPPFIPEQAKPNKNNINLNYREAPPPTREQLSAWHGARWMRVRNAWLQQAARREARYEDTQKLLNKININSM